LLIIGLDDTDILGTRGTGHLARSIAGVLAETYPLLGVTRHQLLVHPQIPCTKNNSCAGILLDAPATEALGVLEHVKALMLADFVPGSDPGLCVAADVPSEITAFGRRVQQEIVTRADACDLAATYGIPLLGLGGDESGVIGALAAIGLAASGEDGRYVQAGRSRDLSGMQSVAALLEVGIAAVRTSDGQPVLEGMVDTDRLRPARRDGQPIAVVEGTGDHWLPLKLD
jgi:hypothetical protein